MRDDFEKAAIEDLINKRDAAKWVAEAERTVENKKALEAYWEQLREYKQKAWLNTGKAGGQVPMVYLATSKRNSTWLVTSCARLSSSYLYMGRYQYAS